MKKCCLSFVIGTVGAALASATGASTPAFDALTPHSEILRNQNVRSDERGAHARATRFGVGDASAPAGVGTGNWSLIGPPGGDVADVAASPTAAGVVLAGVAPGGSWGG